MGSFVKRGTGWVWAPVGGVLLALTVADGRVTVTEREFPVFAVELPAEAGPYEHSQGTDPQSTYTGTYTGTGTDSQGGDRLTTPV
ncbi:two-component sensor histidine kinase, partial [Streptomyces sp. BE282]|nr:two-component sensor histidine kinase [Streptomyces sp. BE282]